MTKKSDKKLDELVNKTYKHIQYLTDVNKLSNDEMISYVLFLIKILSENFMDWTGCDIDKFNKIIKDLTGGKYE